MLRHNSLGGPVSFLVLALAFALAFGAVGTAEAQCAVGTSNGTECIVDSEHVVSGVQNFTLPLHILGTGVIRAAGQAGFTLNIDTGVAGPTTPATDDFIMEDGALVSGQLVFGTCANGFNQGAPITININGGNGIIKHGATVTSRSNCPGGWVQILTSNAGTILISGLVESVANATGGSGNIPGGGPITIIAGCALTVDSTGVVSSRGRDPGADLVHLEGCKVTVAGLVESTGTGHSFVNSPPNSCSDIAPGPGSPPRRNPATRPGHPNTLIAHASACVEIWGDTVEINSLGTNRGEVHADVAFAGGVQGRGWVEVFARNLISILDGTGNDTRNPNDPTPSVPPASAFTPPIAAIHVNAGFPVSNAQAGTIDVISLNGPINGTGFVAEASSVSNDSNGGDINFQSGGALTLDAATLAAQGNFTVQSGFGTGGVMAFQAFTGALNWTSGEGNVLPTGTLVPVADRGVITFANCPGGVNLGTTTFPSIGAATTPSIVACGAAPVLPAYVILPAANCNQVCEVPPPAVKRGIKFDDRDNSHSFTPGDVPLAGWTIQLLTTAGVLVATDVTDALGAYEFTAVSPGSYVVCEVLQAGWTQTFPVGPATAPPGDGIANCQAPGFPAGLAPFGYAIVLSSGEVDEGNDFGNFQDVDECPEDPRAVLTKTVNLKLPAGGNNFHTVQAAYDAAVNNDVIGLFTTNCPVPCTINSTTENVVLGGSKTLKITQCTVAKVTAADNNLPVWTVSSTGVLTIVGPDAFGGTVGWLITNGPHDIKGVRASGASQFGMLHHRQRQQGGGRDFRRRELQLAHGQRCRPADRG